MRAVLFLFLSLCLPLLLITPTTSINADTFSFKPTSKSTKDLYESTLTSLEFHEFARLIHPTFNTSPAFNTWSGPVTMFASTSNPLSPDILSDYTVPGLYTFSTLLSIPNGMRLPSMSLGNCVKIWSYPNAEVVLVGGAQIMHPDLFLSDTLVIHGLDETQLPPLSPTSCGNDQMFFSFQFPLRVDPSIDMHFHLRDVMVRLTTRGNFFAALGIKHIFHDLLHLETATLFIVDDEWLFRNVYPALQIHNHVIPDLYLPKDELIKLRGGEKLPTLGSQRIQLMVTTFPKSKFFHINFAIVKEMDIVRNDKIVVHLLSKPLTTAEAFEEFMSKDEKVAMKMSYGI